MNAGAASIYGIGIDLVETARIAQAISKAGFLARCFTAAEQAYCSSHTHAAPAYAARWAAKEAVAKAFGTGIGAELSLVEIEVYKLPSGQPAIRLSGNSLLYATQLKVREIKVSLTHTDDYAAAYVIVLVESDREDYAT